MIAQYGSYAFMLRRNQKGKKLEISFAQKNKWSKDWMQYWFYVRTEVLTSTGLDGNKNTCYPLESVMTPMKPSTQGTLGPGTSEGREACNKVLPWPVGTPKAGIWWRKWWQLTTGPLVGTGPPRPLRWIVCLCLAKVSGFLSRALDLRRAGLRKSW